MALDGALQCYFWDFMLWFQQGSINAFIHGTSEGLGLMVPSQVNANVLFCWTFLHAFLDLDVSMNPQGLSISKGHHPRCIQLPSSPWSVLDHA